MHIGTLRGRGRNLCAGWHVLVALGKAGDGMDYSLPQLLQNAIEALAAKGHPVTRAEGIVPGLYDVAGIGRDLTIGQVIDVASRLPK